MDFYKILEFEISRKFELFRADGETDRQTDRNDEANIRFSKFCKRLKVQEAF
jgi:hypothetical protein